MKSYSQTHVFDFGKKTFAEIALVLVKQIRDPRLGEPLLRCHEVARVVGEVLGLKVVDGLVHGCDHSWLTFGDGAILDVYAIGVLPQVLLVDALSPFRLAYQPGKARKDVRRDVVRRLVADSERLHEDITTHLESYGIRRNGDKPWGRRSRSAARRGATRRSRPSASREAARGSSGSRKRGS